MADPGIADLARGLLLEAVEVGRAEGARLGDEDVDAVLTGTRRYGDRTGQLHAVRPPRPDSRSNIGTSPGRSFAGPSGTAFRSP